MPVSDFMTVFFVIIKKSTLFLGRKGGFRQIAVDEKIAEKVGFWGFFIFVQLWCRVWCKESKKFQILL